MTTSKLVYVGAGIVLLVIDRSDIDYDKMCAAMEAGEPVFPYSCELDGCNLEEFMHIIGLFSPEYLDDARDMILDWFPDGEYDAIISSDGSLSFIDYFLHCEEVIREAFSVPEGESIIDNFNRSPEGFMSQMLEKGLGDDDMNRVQAHVAQIPDDRQYLSDEELNMIAQLNASAISVHRNIEIAAMLMNGSKQIAGQLLTAFYKAEMHMAANNKPHTLLIIEDDSAFLEQLPRILHSFNKAMESPRVDQIFKGEERLTSEQIRAALERIK